MYSHFLAWPLPVPPCKVILIRCGQVRVTVLPVYGSTRLLLMGMAVAGCSGPVVFLEPTVCVQRAGGNDRLPSRESARIISKENPDCVCAQLAVGIGHLITVGGPFVTALVISDGLGGFRSFGRCLCSAGRAFRQAFLHMVVWLQL